MNSISVHKFGGAALADAASISRVIELVKSTTSSPRVIVVSAMEGDTDALLQVVNDATAGKESQALRGLRELRQKKFDLISDLLQGNCGTRELSRTISESFHELELLVTGSEDGRACTCEIAEQVVAQGERHSARILCFALEAAGIVTSVVDAMEVVHIDGTCGSAQLSIARMEPALRCHVLPLLERDITVIVPGFFGRTADGTLATLGRGGSDLTATALARALGATSVTLWKDVPGFLTADPRIVPDARVLNELHASEAADLAHWGASVLHPRSALMLDARTTLWIRPFVNRQAAGTKICAGKVRGGPPVRAISVLLDADSADRSERASAARASERTGVATIAVVGKGVVHNPGVTARISAAVSDAGINVLGISQKAEHTLSLVVASDDASATARAIHRAFQLDRIGGGRPIKASGVEVVLVGCGRIGCELIAQLSHLEGTVRERLRIIAIVDRSGFVFARRGYSARQLCSISAAKQRGEPIARMHGGIAGTASEAITHIASHALTRPVIVDVSNGDTREALLLAVEHGMNLVLANKIPLASDGVAAHALLVRAPAIGRQVRHEATVGAGLPIIDTIAKLSAVGDRVLSISGCPSGTLGYLFGELGRGRSFSDALRQAMARGYTEPDPREDLSGEDVARKALILARLIGFTGEPADIVAESLIPEHLREMPMNAYLEQLNTQDEEWRCRAAQARARGEVLRYRVQVTRLSVKVGLAAVPLGSALASLTGTDNQFTITTRRYRENPIVITGPGAGVAVTAGGVLSDLLRVAGV